MVEVKYVGRGLALAVGSTHPKLGGMRAVIRLYHFTRKRYGGLHNSDDVNRREVIWMCLHDHGRSRKEAEDCAMAVLYGDMAKHFPEAVRHEYWKGTLVLEYHTWPESHAEES